jgi:hypothetical protein
MPHDDAFELDGELFDAWRFAELAIKAEEAPQRPATGTFGIGFEEGQIEDVMSALAHIDGTDREQWFRVMCALHSTGDDAAWDILDDWSQQFATYDVEENAHQWDSLSNSKDRKYSLGTLFWDAKQAGWRAPKMRHTFEGEAEAEKGRPPFFITFKELVTSEDVPPEWTISGMFERGTLASVFGATGSFKSFLTIDMAVHVAAGRDWHGRPVRQGGVVYLCGEGHRGMSRRMKAARRHHGMPEDLPLVVSSRAKNLMRVEEQKYVHAEIDAAMEVLGQRIEMIVIDTRRRFMAGDGNKDEDVDVFRDACDALRLRYDCLVLVVHHTGHGDLTRSKGASGWGQDLDDEYRMAVTEGLTASLSDTKGKERPGGSEFTVTFEPIPLDAVDWDGDEVSSLAVQSFSDGVPVPKQYTPRVQQVMACYRELLEAQQKVAGRENVMVSSRDLVELVRERHYKRNEKAKAAVDETVRVGALVTEGMHVWIDNSGLPF